MVNVASDQLEELEDVGGVLKTVREEIKKFEARREADRTRQVVQRWKDAAIYPYESEPSGAVEEVQRDVFHLVAQQIDKHLPHFHKRKPRSSERCSSWSGIRWKRSRVRSPS